ncbi:hypothetical protein MRS_145 [Staphylococcus phage MR003]|nr:hypothetical protein MRS_145 [Staphylococcus phage MR003]
MEDNFINSLSNEEVNYLLSKFNSIKTHDSLVTFDDDKNREILTKRWNTLVEEPREMLREDLSKTKNLVVDLVDRKLQDVVNSVLKYEYKGKYGKNIYDLLHSFEDNEHIKIVHKGKTSNMSADLFSFTIDNKAIFNFDMDLIRLFPYKPYKMCEDLKILIQEKIDEVLR